jgi:hypothetical protein
LIDFDPNLMEFDRHFWAYAVVDNLLRKSNVGNWEQGTGNLGTPVPRAKAGTGNREPGTGNRSEECRVESAECRVKN